MITHPEIIDIQGENDVDDMDSECNKGEHMWYFDALQENHRSGPLVYRHLLKQAKESIYVWDPYLNKGDAVLFSDISKEVDIKILTTFGASVTNRYTQSFQDFLDEIVNYQKTCGYGLEIKFLNSRCVQNVDTKPFYDRYLFVDNKRFSVGASLIDISYC